MDESGVEGVTRAGSVDGIDFESRARVEFPCFAHDRALLSQFNCDGRHTASVEEFAHRAWILFARHRPSLHFVWKKYGRQADQIKIFWIAQPGFVPAEIQGNRAARSTQFF